MSAVPDLARLARAELWPIEYGAPKAPARPEPAAFLSKWYVVVHVAVAGTGRDGAARRGG
jgi:hypothetical protein